MDGGVLHDLPLHPSWSSSESYVTSLLSLISTTDLFRNLCGGVHILDFLTREPDLYTWVLPADWREWFELVDIHDLLDLLLREDLTKFQDEHSLEVQSTAFGWRGYPAPPQSLIQYVEAMRRHMLVRSFQPVSSNIGMLPHHISVGMKPKKMHEVTNFAAYVDSFSTTISASTSTPLSIIDFGSGQNYLGRTLACPPYNKHVIAIEQRHHNVEGARGMDVHAKLAKKEKIMRNKKEYKRQLTMMKDMEISSTEIRKPTLRENGTANPDESGTQTPVVETVAEVIEAVNDTTINKIDATEGSMTYVEHVLESGHLEHILEPQNGLSKADKVTVPRSLVVSIHSCGNLTHHGLRSITLNPSVQAVAMIGCCYNLLTERLGPVTYKHPQLRPNHPRLEATGSAHDPHGFPMSKRFEDFEFDMQTEDGSTKREKGIRLNITARMMAVQAPYNWGREDSEMFFTRHFYRALLQRILLDRGVVKHALSPDHVDVAGGSLSGKDTEGTPLIIGSLRKSAFVSFQAYVKAALEKLTTGNPNPDEANMIGSMTSDLVSRPEIIQEYEQKYGYARKHLAVIWSLMAFSAGVVESAIVVDRWLWLKEQPEIQRAWVEAVFAYDESPRNLCVYSEFNGKTWESIDRVRGDTQKEMDLTLAKPKKRRISKLLLR